MTAPAPTTPNPGAGTMPLKAWALALTVLIVAAFALVHEIGTAARADLQSELADQRVDTLAKLVVRDDARSAQTKAVGDSLLRIANSRERPAAIARAHTDTAIAAADSAIIGGERARADTGAMTAELRARLARVDSSAATLIKQVTAERSTAAAVHAADSLAIQQLQRTIAVLEQEIADATALHEADLVATGAAKAAGACHVLWTIPCPSRAVAFVGGVVITIGILFALR